MIIYAKNFHYKLLFVFLFLGLILPTMAYAKDVSPQEKIVMSMGGEAIEKLASKKLSDKQREAHMRKLLDRYFDMTAIGRFALGRNWRKASKVQQKQYLKLFKDMVVRTYAHKFKDYSGEQFEVTGSKILNKRDTIVNSRIIPKDAPKLSIDWRVRKKANEYKIIDIIIEGVSMSVTQRSEFASIIQQGGGNVEFLIAELNR